MPIKTETILVVDDDVRMLRLMARTLELENYRVLKASTGEEALDIFFVEDNPDLVLLDVLMPGIDGCTVCRRIREFSQVPVIMVTAKGNDEEKVEGLDAGADDYITKPFSTKELTARVKAVLRRSNLWGKDCEPALCVGELSIDFGRQRVTVDDDEVNLTATEYHMLLFMAQNAGRVVTPDQILETVWGTDYIGESHLLHVNMGRLRKKLKDNPRDPRYILTKHGIGYALAKA